MAKAFTYLKLLICTLILGFVSCDLSTDNTSYLWVTFPVDKYPDVKTQDTIGVWADGMDNVPFISNGETQTGERIYLCTNKKLELRGNVVAMYPYQKSAVYSGNEVCVRINDDQHSKNSPIFVGTGEVGESDIDCAAVRMREVTATLDFNLMNVHDIPTKQNTPALRKLSPVYSYDYFLTLRIIPDEGQPSNFFHKSGWVTTKNQQITYTEADVASVFSGTYNCYENKDTISIRIYLLPEKYSGCKLQVEWFLNYDSQNVYVFPIEGRTFSKGMAYTYDFDLKNASVFSAYMDHNVSCGLPCQFGTLICAPSNYGTKDIYISPGTIYIDCPEKPGFVKIADNQYLPIPRGWRKPTYEEMQFILQSQHGDLYLRGNVTGYWYTTQSMDANKATLDSLFLPLGDYIPISSQGYLHLVKE